MSQSNFLQALGWALLNSLWQMALLWILYQFITSVIKIRKPSQKASLASTFLIGGFVWFIFTFIALSGSLISPNSSVIKEGIMSEYGSGQVNSWLRVALPIASVVYLFLLILPVIRFFRNYRFVKQIGKQGLSKIDVQWRMFVRRIAEQMSIRKKVQIWVSELVSSPVTIGFLKPIILVPLAAINNLTPQQLEAVLLHELSHIKRYDYLLNLVINLIQTILYYNPFVKAFVQIVEKEREKSCDEMVIQFQYDPHGYASALLMLEKTNHVNRQLAVAASGKKNDLLQRVELIIGIKKKPVVSFNKIAGLFAGILCIIAINGLFIFNKKSFGDNKDISFTAISSPFYFYSDQGKSISTTPTKKQVPIIINDKDAVIAQSAVKKPIVEKNSSENKYHISSYSNEAAPYFVNVKYTQEPEAPQLKSYQEEQVKEAMEASKKVVKEEQWKTVEKSIADAMTTAEKNNLRSAYMKHLNNNAAVDWKKLENKLRISYDQINWDLVNTQLGTALNEIRLDSLQRVYTIASDYFTTLEKQLNECQQKGLTDSDVTIDSVELKKAQVERVLNRIRAVRNKKVIHL